MPGFPQRVALLGLCRPLERATAMVRRDGLHGFGLLLYPGVRPMKFDEQGVFDWVVHTGITIERIHLHLVEQLNAGHRYAQLYRLDHRVDRPLEAVKRANRRSHRLRNTV